VAHPNLAAAPERTTARLSGATFRKEAEFGMNSDPRAWIATLRGSHDRLAELVAPMTPAQLREQSYCTDWSVAQVLSHLGSGAELTLLGLPAALGESEPPSPDSRQPIWDRWNAKSPDDQVADALVIDERLVATLEQLTDDQLATMKMEFFGMQLDAVGIIRLRLGEHVLHTWDVAEHADPAATVSAAAAALLVDSVPGFLAPRLGKPLAEPFAVRVTTFAPDRDYLLSSGESVTMTDWPGDDGAVPQVRMPAESLLRLAYGRLDPAHTGAEVSGDRAVLDKLRAIFPGF
jgi:uncharacterized protein (TIGR03083 family)